MQLTICSRARRSRRMRGLDARSERGVRAHDEPGQAGGRLLAWRDDRARRRGTGSRRQRHDAVDLAADAPVRSERTRRRLRRDDARCEKQHHLSRHAGRLLESGGLYTVGASYGLDYQDGTIRNRIALDGEPIRFDDQILRHVFRVGVTVAPRYSRSILPPDEAARAKGVSR